jgi:hypothetical protein
MYQPLDSVSSDAGHIRSVHVPSSLTRLEPSCCRVCSKTLLIAAKDHLVLARQRLGRGQLVAGFEVSINCRFWVSTEGEHLHVCSAMLKSALLAEISRSLPEASANIELSNDNLRRRTVFRGRAKRQSGRSVNR